MQRLLPLILLCLFTSSCSGDLDGWIGDYYRKNVPQATDSLGRANDRLLRKGKMPETDPRTCIVDLTNIIPFEWDTMYVVFGYYENAQVDKFIEYKKRKRFPSSFRRKTLFSKGDKIIHSYFQEEYLSDPIISSPQFLSDGIPALKIPCDSARFEIHIENHEYHLKRISEPQTVPQP